MKLHIISPFRPKRRGLDRRLCPMYQDDNGLWREDGINGNIHNIIKDDDILIRCGKSLQKNSAYRHKITIAHEPDIYFNENYKNMLYEKYNMNFFTASKYTYEAAAKAGSSNVCSTLREATLSINDDEFVCYSYIADLVCGKNWDKHIKEAYDVYGDNKVYVPMFVEPRQRLTHAHNRCIGLNYPDNNYLEDTTVESIWVTWRKTCNHALTMKYPIDRDYFVEKDLDDWSNICDKFDKKIIIEPCGLRDYGYYCTLIAKNKIFKKSVYNLLRTDVSPDLAFEGELGVDKVVVTKSHVFHLHNKCILDDIEVEHETIV